MYFVFFKQKTAYEMRISDWSSDVCSSDLQSSSCAVAVPHAPISNNASSARFMRPPTRSDCRPAAPGDRSAADAWRSHGPWTWPRRSASSAARRPDRAAPACQPLQDSSEEHTSELQSLMRLSSVVFCLYKT